MSSPLVIKFAHSSRTFASLYIHHGAQTLEALNAVKKIIEDYSPEKARSAYELVIWFECLFNAGIDPDDLRELESFGIKFENKFCSRELGLIAITSKTIADHVSEAYKVVYIDFDRKIVEFPVWLKFKNLESLDQWKVDMGYQKTRLCRTVEINPEYFSFENLNDIAEILNIIIQYPEFVFIYKNTYFLAD